MGRSLYNFGTPDDVNDADLQVGRSFVKEMSDVVKAVSMRWPNLSRLKIRNLEIQFAS